MTPAITWSSVTAMLAPGPPPAGRVDDSQVAGLSVCTDPALAAFSRFANVISCCLYFSSGFLLTLRIGQIQQIDIHNRQR